MNVFSEFETVALGLVSTKRFSRTVQKALHPSASQPCARVKKKQTNIGHTCVVVFVRLLHVLKDPHLKTAGNIAKSAGVRIFNGQL